MKRVYNFIGVLSFLSGMAAQATYRYVDLSTDPSYSVERFYNGDPRKTYRVIDYKQRQIFDFATGEIDDQLEIKFRRDTDVDSFDLWDDEY